MQVAARVLEASRRSHKGARWGASLFTQWRGFSQRVTEADNVKPLEGVKILDLTRVLAGPFATMILGDLGAEVIKVEKPGSGDDTRSWGPPFVGTESSYFLSVNRNKKSIAVNMKDPKGAKIIQELAQACDVLIENYIPGKLAEMGLGYEDVKKTAPHIIYCSITGYGQSGPLFQRAGYDAVACAMSGLMHITGPEDGDPVRPGVAMTDLATGLYAHGAIMAGLLQKNKIGKGMHIDCNLLSSQVACLTHVAANFLNGGVEAKRWGTAHGSIVPYQEDLSKEEETVECGTQEEAVECGSQEEAGVSGSQEEEGLSGSQEKAGPSRSLTESQVPPLRLPNKRPRKGSHMQDSVLRLIQEASASLRATPTPEEAFACMASTKLQDMQEGQRLLCEDLIYKVLTKGVRGEITNKTHLSWTILLLLILLPQLHHQSHSVEGRPESDDLGSVWSGKRCSLLYDHSLGTQMSSAAFWISGTSGPDCSPLHIDSSGHQFCSKIIDVCPGGQRLRLFLLFLQRCLPLCLVLSP